MKKSLKLNNMEIIIKDNDKKTLTLTDEGLDTNDWLYLSLVDEHTGAEATNMVSLDELYSALQSFMKQRELMNKRDKELRN